MIWLDGGVGRFRFLKGRCCRCPEDGSDRLAAERSGTMLRLTDSMLLVSIQELCWDLVAVLTPESSCSRVNDSSASSNWPVTLTWICGCVFRSPTSEDVLALDSFFL